MCLKNVFEKFWNDGVVDVLVKLWLTNKLEQQNAHFQAILWDLARSVSTQRMCWGGLSTTITSHFSSTAVQLISYDDYCL